MGSGLNKRGPEGWLFGGRDLTVSAAPPPQPRTFSGMMSEISLQIFCSCIFFLIKMLILQGCANVVVIEPEDVRGQLLQ